MRICHAPHLLAIPIFFVLTPKAVVAPQQSTRASSAQSSAHATAYQFDLEATKQWMDTKADLRQGEKLRFVAVEMVTYPADGRLFGPQEGYLEASKI